MFIKARVCKNSSFLVYFILYIKQRILNAKYKIIFFNPNCSWCSNYCVLSPLSIPIGIVPVTLQTLAVGLVATVLKARETFFAYLTLSPARIYWNSRIHWWDIRNCGSFWPNRWFSNCLFNNGNSYFFWPSSN